MYAHITVATRCAFVGLSRNLRFWHGIDVWHYDFVDKATETQTEIACNLAHALDQQLAQIGQFLLVVLHGLAQVHKIVEIHGIIFRLGISERHSISFI